MDNFSFYDNKNGNKGGRGGGIQGGSMNRSEAIISNNNGLEWIVKSAVPIISQKVGYFWGIKISL